MIHFLCTWFEILSRYIHEKWNPWLVWYFISKYSRRGEKSRYKNKLIGNQTFQFLHTTGYYKRRHEIVWHARSTSVYLTYWLIWINICAWAFSSSVVVDLKDQKLLSGSKNRPHHSTSLSNCKKNCHHHFLPVLTCSN